jgi:hypothetical protein
MPKKLYSYEICDNIDKCYREIFTEKRVICTTTMKEGIIALQGNNKLWAYYDRFGNKITDFKYYDWEYCGDDRIPVKNKEGLWSIIDRTGKELIDFKYNRIYRFSEGFARAAVNDVYCHIDKSGNQLTELIFENIQPFKNGLAIVKKDGLYFVLNTKGKIISKRGYQYINGFFNGFSHAYLSNSVKRVVIDIAGNETPEYDWIQAPSFINDYKIKANIGLDFFFIDFQGNILGKTVCQ